MTTPCRGIVSVLGALVLVGALLAPSTAAAAVDDDCPSPVPEHEIRRGMRGTGYTVAQDRIRRSFSAEVVGVLEDALGPGRDMIVVEASGSVIEDNGGIWGGMSGSPVFVGDELLGAVAFGLAFGPTQIAGLTPATEMYRVMEYPSEDSAPMPRRVRLPAGLRERIARRYQASAEEISGSLSQLEIPMSVSGVSRDGLARIGEIVDRENLPLIPYAGSASTATTTAASSDIRPGDNLVAALSYGDITFAGVGTATFVCDGRAMAFGHPMLWEGDTILGANAGSTMAIVKDPFFAYELATIEESVGSVDQDRFAGIRTTLGLRTPLIPVTSSIHALNTGRSRDGRTEATISEVLPFLAYFHLAGNMLMTMDEYSAGSAELTWSIHGTDADGDAWSFDRSNMYSSEWGIADESTFELSSVLNSLYFNQFEDIEFTSVDVRGSADDEIEQYVLTSVAVSRDGVEFSDKSRVRARPGDTIYLRALLTPYEGEDRTVDLSVTIPNRARSDGFLELRGGGFAMEEAEICLYDPSQCTDAAGKRIESFDDLLASLASKPKNNELVAKLRMGGRNRVRSSSSALLDQVVKGEAFVFVRVIGASGGRGGGGVVSDPGVPPGE